MISFSLAQLPRRVVFPDVSFPHAANGLRPAAGRKLRRFFELCGMMCDFLDDLYPSGPIR